MQFKELSEEQLEKLSREELFKYLDNKHRWMKKELQKRGDKASQNFKFFVKHLRESRKDIDTR